MGSNFNRSGSRWPSYSSFLSFFLSLRHVEKYGASRSFLCQVMCCARSPPPAHPLSSFEEEEGKGEIPVVIVGWRCNPVAMPPSTPTNNRVDYDKEGGGGCNKRGGWRISTSDKSGQWTMLRVRLSQPPETSFQDDTNIPCCRHSPLPYPRPLCVIR
jgi:hypothetical protein